MATKLQGKYEFKSAENVEDYLKGLGVGLVFRRVQSVAKPSLEITHESATDEWTIQFTSPFKTQVQKFKIGSPVDDETYDARKCKTTAKVEGDKLVLFQECDEGPKVVVTKELTGDGHLKMTLHSGEFSSVHLFEKKTE